MPRTAAVKIRFTPSTEPADYVVERHQGQVVACLGRVTRFGNVWSALGIGAAAWTPYRRTRKEAVADMLRTS